jgi:hypothetical protein
VIKIWNQAEVIRQYKAGVSCADIAAEHGVSVRQIERITRPYRPEKMVSGRTSADGQFVSMNRSIIDQILIGKFGMDPYWCLLCNKKQKRKCDIHHTKYERATIENLLYACRKCNTNPRFQGLK